MRDEVYDGDDGRAGDDIAGRSRWLIALLGVMLRRPQDTIAGAVAITALATILVNALFLQPNPHPAPIFSVKPKASGSVQESTGTIVLPRPRPAALTAPRTEPATRSSPGRSRSEIVTDVQRELARRRFYDGAVDGIHGSRSAAAIRAFEQAAGLVASGEPSEALLQAIARAPNVMKPVSGPVTPRHDAIGELVARTEPQAPTPRPDPNTAVAPTEPSAPPPRPEPATIALRPDPLATSARPEPVAAPPRTEPIAMLAPRQEPGPAAAPTAPNVSASLEPPRPGAAVPSSQVKAVQRALSEFGYGQVKPTGIVDAETRAAIEQFEGARDMSITGQVSDDLVRELGTMTGRPIE